MEPADLNSTPDANGDTRLEALLRRESPPLADDGFSTRVLAALPAPEKRRAPWRRTLFCVVGAAAGCGYALWRGVAAADLEAGAARLGHALVNLGPSIADPLFVAAMGITLLSLVMAFRNELREKLLS